MAVGARGRHHVQIESDLDRPARVVHRVAGATVLVHLVEAAVGRRARRQAVLGSNRPPDPPRRSARRRHPPRRRSARPRRCRRAGCRHSPDRSDQSRRGQSGRDGRGGKSLDVGSAQGQAAELIRSRRAANSNRSRGRCRPSRAGRPGARRRMVRTRRQWVAAPRPWRPAAPGAVVTETESAAMSAAPPNPRPISLMSPLPAPRTHAAPLPLAGLSPRTSPEPLYQAESAAAGRGRRADRKWRGQATPTSSRPRRARPRHAAPRGPATTGRPGLLAEQDPADEWHRRRTVGDDRLEMLLVGEARRVAEAADDARRGHGRRPRAAPEATAARTRRSRSRSHIPIEPTKYVDSCVDVSRARSHFLRASDSSWKPPRTIRSSASVLGHRRRRGSRCRSWRW